ncbi:hypothetical protein MG293_002327 [Ovis ammon polii]|uniref:Uncharacterized protein n=1 Tax=Ovis ammon polii TaxID=230172 RepID=A0AAD4YFW0_OVIAM|nr:hypothetical protein MG293_002327 [Ovis ammon polii]
MVLVDVPGRLGSEGPRRPWEEGPDPGLTLVITAARCGDEGTFGEAPELPQGPQLCFDTKVQGHVTAAERSCPSEGCAGDGVQGPHGVCRCDSDRKSNVCGCPSALQGLTAAQALASRVTWASHPLPGPSGDDGPGVKCAACDIHMGNRNEAKAIRKMGFGGPDDILLYFLVKASADFFRRRGLSSSRSGRPGFSRPSSCLFSNKKFWTLTMYQPLPRLLLPSFSDSFVETDPIFKTIAYIRCFCEFGFHVQEGQWGGVCLCEEFFLLLRPLTDPFFESRPFYYNVSSALLYRTSQPENAFFFISSDVISTSRNGKKTGVLAFKANEAQRG